MTISKETVAITVTFNPNPDILKDQLESLRTQCQTIIVDNGSHKEHHIFFEKYLNKNKQGKLITLDNNIGISNAQNIGIKHVILSLPEAKYILLLDHDSVPHEGMVRKLENEFHFLQGAGKKIAAIGPLLFDKRDQKYLGFHVIRHGLWKKIIPTQDSSPLECHSLNSSGSLLSLDALKNIGFLEKNFFMDHGETEWCFRARARGYQVYGTANVIMSHLMGDEICEYWFFGKKRMPYRSPKRHYYIVRNSILMQKRSYIPRTWKFWNIMKLIFTYLYFGYIAQEAQKHRKYIIKGVHDGLQGVTGQLCEN